MCGCSTANDKIIASKKKEKYLSGTVRYWHSGTRLNEI